MMMRLFLLFVLTILAACNSERDTAFEQPKQAKPALWLVEGKGGSAYLFGTMHALPKDVVWRVDTLDTAIERADWLVLELDPADDTAQIRKIFGEMAASPDQGTLEDRIRPSLRDTARDVMNAANLSGHVFENIENWGAALMIGSSTAAGVGASGNYGAEKILTQEFGRRAKPVAGLESAAQQLGYFDTMPDADQRAMLEAVIESADEAVPDYQRILTSWLSGDLDALRDATRTGFLARPGIRQALVTRRNALWADKIAALLAKRKTRGFIAVGAGHLVGEDGVQAMLAARGLKVTRVQ